MKTPPPTVSPFGSPFWRHDMANIQAMLEEGWAAIQSRFLDTLRRVAEGGDPGDP